MSVMRFLKAQPHVVRAALTSSAIMMVGDVLAQQVAHNPSQKQRVDWKRTARFGVVGLTLHGPYFYKGMKTIDQQFGPAKTFVNAAKKAVVSQITLFPPFVALLFGWVGVLEGRSPKGVVQKVKDNYPSAFKFGMVFWPCANLINFRFVEPAYRILYVSMAGLIWNTFISWQNAQHRTIALPQPKG